MKNIVITFFLGVIITSYSEDIKACTAFCLKTADSTVFGFNFDYQIGDGYIYINKRNVERHKYSFYAERQIYWTSKYGNITFNMHGREIPEGGMNEMGLVVKNLGYDESIYPEPDERLPIDESGWVQYQLDNSATIEDVIESLKLIRISNRCIATCHYIIADKTGNSMVIDFINGKVEYYVLEKLPYPILTNDSYSSLLNDIKRYKGFGGTSDIKLRVGSSCSRFNYVANQLKNYNQTNNPIIDYAFNILNDCKQAGTRFQIVYDLKNLNLYYYSQHSKKRKIIHFSDFDFDCKSPILITDIQSNKEGNIRNGFFDYTTEINKKTIYKVFKYDFDFIPKEVLNTVAEIPDESKCFSVEAKNNNENKPDSLTALLIAQLSSNVIIPHKSDIVKVSLQIKLNRPAPKDISFTLEVPKESTVIPGKNVFIITNPIRIEKGRQSATATALVLPERLPSGLDLKLIINLLSNEVDVDRANQVIIKVKRELPVKPEIVFEKRDKRFEVGINKTWKSVHFQDCEREMYRFALFKTKNSQIPLGNRTHLNTYGRAIIGKMFDSIAYCIPLEEGVEIGPNSFWTNSFNHSPVLYCKNYPDWAGKTAYVGVTIRDWVTGSLLYGWIKLEVSHDGSVTRILSFAYEKNGLPLKTGQIK